MKLSKIRILLLVLCATLILTGCSITGRLFTIRGQMCEFDEFVVLSMDQQLEVALREPVLLERDIYLLMDALPTTRVSFPEGVVAGYVFEQVQMNPDGESAATGMEIEFSFVFIQSDGKLRLSKITSSEIPPEILASVTLLAASSASMAEQACDVSINPFKRSVVMEVDQEMLNLLPDRRTAMSWFGPSLRSADNNDSLVYEFKLKGNQGDRPIVRIDANYDDMGEHLETVKASFTRYDARIDAPEGTVRLTLNR